MPASDVRSKGIPIELDKPRRLRYDFNALALLEDKFGSLDAALEELGKKGTIKGIRTLLHVGLVHEDPALTEHQVGKAITFEDLPRVVQAIGDAFKEAFPKVDPPKPPETPEGTMEAEPS